MRCYTLRWSRSSGEEKAYTTSVRIDGNMGKARKAKTPFYAWTLKQHKPLAAALFPITELIRNQSIAKEGYLIAPTVSEKIDDHEYPLNNARRMHTV